MAAEGAGLRLIKPAFPRSRFDDTLHRGRAQAAFDRNSLIDRTEEMSDPRAAPLEPFKHKVRRSSGREGDAPETKRVGKTQETI